MEEGDDGNEAVGASSGPRLPPLARGSGTAHWGSERAGGKVNSVLKAAAHLYSTVWLAQQGVRDVWLGRERSVRVFKNGKLVSKYATDLGR